MQPVSSAPSRSAKELKHIKMKIVQLWIVKIWNIAANIEHQFAIKIGLILTKLCKFEFSL